MSAGLPGLGLGGLFFIFSALLAPFRQLWRTFRGRSRPGDWAMIGRQFAQATVMVAAIDLSLRLAYVGIGAAGLGNPPPAVSATVIPLTLIGITSALLVGVLATAKFADIAVRLRTAEFPGVPDVLPRATPLRTLALGGVVAVAWLALLVAGASELSPLESRRGDERTTEQRPQGVEAPKSKSARSHGRPQTEAFANPASATPRASDAGQPAPKPDLEPDNSEAEIVLEPAVATPVPSPSSAAPHQKQTPPAEPPASAPSPPPTSSGSGPPSVANPPHATGPPASAGPPEGSPAPEHAGPPGGSPPNKSAAPREEPGVKF